MATDSPPYEIFRQNLRALLEARGISQNELARMTGMYSADVSNMMSGKMEPRLSKIQRIVEVLGIDWSDLFSKEFDPAKAHV